MITSTEVTTRVREAAVLSQVIGQYVRLKPAGKDRLAGLCPFHRDRSPSFFICPSKGLWTCFGCHAGGDVFSFVSKIEGVSFLQARASLAEQYGISLEDRPRTRAEILFAQRQQADIKNIAIETSIWFTYVRSRYQFRYDLMVKSAEMASDADDDVAYLHYASRAWRWGSILLRFDAKEPAALRLAYLRIRTRPDVVAVVALHQAAEKRAEETWGRVIAAADKLTEEQCYRVTAAVHAAESGGAAAASEVVGS